jgi:hypothetical protein
LAETSARSTAVGRKCAGRRSFALVLSKEAYEFRIALLATIVVCHCSVFQELGQVLMQPHEVDGRADDEMGACHDPHHVFLFKYWP